MTWMYPPPHCKTWHTLDTHTHFMTWMYPPPHCKTWHTLDTHSTHSMRLEDVSACDHSAPSCRCILLLTWHGCILLLKWQGMLLHATIQLRSQHKGLLFPGAPLHLLAFALSRRLRRPEPHSLLRGPRTCAQLASRRGVCICVSVCVYRVAWIRGFGRVGARARWCDWCARWCDWCSPRRRSPCTRGRRVGQLSGHGTHGTRGQRPCRGPTGGTPCIPCLQRTRSPP